MAYIGTTHGKIILMGEHSVVYGYPCLALPFFETKVIAETSTITKGQTLYCDFYKGDIQHLPTSMQGLKAVITESLKRLHKENAPLNITITSSIPIERGMGSSAAVAGAVVRSIYHYFDAKLDHNTLLSLIAISETLTHQKPSGIDALTTTSDKALYFIKDKKAQWIHVNLDAELLIVDTGILGKTKEAVHDVASNYHKASIQNALKTLGALTYEAKQAIEERSVETLGRLMTEAHHALQHLGVSSKELDHLVTIAQQYGALGSKLTGGGRGGCMIVLCRPNQKQSLIEALRPHANHIWSILSLIHI